MTINSYYYKMILVNIFAKLVIGLCAQKFNYCSSSLLIFFILLGSIPIDLENEDSRSDLSRFIAIAPSFVCADLQKYIIVLSCVLYKKVYDYYNREFPFEALSRRSYDSKEETLLIRPHSVTLFYDKITCQKLH